MWTLIRLTAPTVDAYFILSDSLQLKVLVGEFWVVWLASAFHIYLSQYNYDMVFGNFKEYFKLNYDWKT